MNDLLFAGSHIYAVVVLSRQLEYVLSDVGASVDTQLLGRAFLGAAWGAAVLAYGVWKRQIYSRMLGVCLIVGPTVMQLITTSPREARYYGWLALGIGLAAWLSSWCVLRFRRKIEVS
jgi:hypothetical protein